MIKKIKNILKGLTLIELLIVIAISGILISTSFSGISTHFKKARDAKRKADLVKVKIVLYDYFSDNNCFPESLPACGLSLGGVGQVYLSNFPCDYNNKPYSYQVDGSNCSQWFRIFTNLENSNDSGIDKVGCRNGCGEECDYNYGVSSTNIAVNKNCPIITPTIAPTMPISPTAAPKIFACTPSGYCAEFIDPELSRCPNVFENDSTCQNLCRDHANRCHDDRGKKN